VDKGLAREAAYAEVMRQLLPTSCEVALGGFLFGHEGHESRQMDILVYSDLALQYRVGTSSPQGKTFTCVDGAVGAVSVKSKLDGDSLRDALDCIESIPAKLPLEGRVPPFVKLGGYWDWPHKVVVAFDGLSQETILGHIEEFYAARGDTPQGKRPHVVHVLGKYCIVRTASEGEETRLGMQLPPNEFVICSNDPDLLGLAKAVTGMHRVAMAMRWLKTDYAELFDRTPLP